MTDDSGNAPASQSSETGSYSSAVGSFLSFPTVTRQPPPAEDVPAKDVPTEDVPAAPSHRQLSDQEIQEKEARKLDKAMRAKSEEEILSRLTEKEQAAIEMALNLVRGTESRWLVMLFKRVAAVRSRELFRDLDQPERFFEAVGGGNYWREAWYIKDVGKQDEHASKKRLGPFITKLLDLFGK
jgi:hypothetical protein